jgi:hypothetical protein
MKLAKFFYTIFMLKTASTSLPYTITGAWKTKKKIYSHGNSHALFVLSGLREGIMAHKPISQNFACDMLLAVT